jgi:glycosyltransferase involved in cell wall biosynthesis
MIDVSAIFTAHGEGIFSGPSLQSFEKAIALARADGISVESIIALDCPTKETVRQFAGVEARGHRVVFSDAKDPGGARNAAVQESRAKFVTFLDGDDLWSFNWIVAAREFCSNAAGAIAHSEINLHFGLVSIAVLHVDSENRLFDEDGLRVVNYWDALVFAPAGRLSCKLKAPPQRHAVVAVR